MLREAIAWLREWIAVENADERIEGSGDAIASPKHRRSPEAERALERADEDRRDGG